MTTRAIPIDIEPITPPPRWRIGLLEDNVGVPQLPPNAIPRLGGAIAYQALDVRQSDLETNSFDPCDEADADLLEGDQVHWNSWGIVEGATCSTLSGLSGRLEETEARAETILAAKSSYLTEYSFWTGLVGGVQMNSGLGWPNIPLTDSASSPNWVDLTPTDGEAGVVEAFGLIHEYLAETLQGLRGAIHVSPQLLPYLQFYGLVMRDGFRLGTYLGDHLVIAGSGYTGSGPGNVPQPDNRSWIYATSMVRVGKSDIQVRGAYDRRNNRANAIAYRAVLAEFDGTAHAGVRVCLTDPGPECDVPGS